MAKLTDQEIANAAAFAGFKGHEIAIAVAIALAESKGVTDATHPNDNGSTDRGVWQINDKAHPEFFGNPTGSDANSLLGRNWKDRNSNAVMAYSIYKAAGNTWVPWSTFKNGDYGKFLARGNAVAGQAAINHQNKTDANYDAWNDTVNKEINDNANEAFMNLPGDIIKGILGALSPALWIGGGAILTLLGVVIIAKKG